MTRSSNEVYQALPGRVRSRVYLTEASALLVGVLPCASLLLGELGAESSTAGPGGVRTRWTSDLPLAEQAERLISAGCRISGRAISDRPGYPAISKRQMPYRVVAFTEEEVDMAALGFGPDTIGFAGTELIRPADPTIFLTAAAAGYTDRTDDSITANTLLRADYRNADDASSLQEVRDRLQFLADTGYDLRHNLPN
ncbi:hypothetical protein [Curtobacterium sp. 1310]|uniref:hypothetical protein n=1 Tax=Curtobacterium sp. 1310 TaxID=2806570 RepID=UPI001AE5B720|nr:hypothetical protein [Curtobacterium sp. 1310]MBP1301446.1 hypothetical protein [Curtobacterium sp. 1310]